MLPGSDLQNIALLQIEVYFLIVILQVTYIKVKQYSYKFFIVQYHKAT